MKTICFLDDDDVYNQILKARIKRHEISKKHAIETFNRPLQLEEYATTIEVDLAVIDLCMDHESGFVVAEKIRDLVISIWCYTAMDKNFIDHKRLENIDRFYNKQTPMAVLLDEIDGYFS